MASPKAQVQKLHDALAQLEVEQEALKNRIAGLRLAIDVLERGADDDENETGRAPRGIVKETLFDLLKAAGQTGLNAHSAVEMAKHRGIELDRATVSSTLSRMKRDGAVDHDGERYRLKGLSQQAA